MTNNEAKQLIQIVKSNWNQCNVVPDEISFSWWVGNLSDLDYKTAFLALQKWTQTHREPPQIADIREMYEQVVAEMHPDWSEAWEFVEKIIRTIGQYEHEKAFTEFAWFDREHGQFNVLEDVVRRIGYTTLCTRDLKNDASMRANFRDIYNTVVKRKHEKKVMSNRLNTAIESKQMEMKSLECANVPKLEQNQNETEHSEPTEKEKQARDWMALARERLGIR